MKKVLTLLLGLLCLGAISYFISQPDLSFIQTAQNDADATTSSMQGNINWLLVMVGLLLGAILVLIFDITNLSSKITGKKILNWNSITAWLCLAFIVFGMIGVVWEFIYHGKYVITDSASEHGIAIQKMFNITLLFTGIVFVVTQILLFVFPLMFYSKEGRKASYFSHNNTLEIVWTAVPFVVMSILVLMGYKTWSEITDRSPNEKAQKIEVFAYQFGWNARYPGDDNKFGEASFNYISGTNPLGLPVEHEIDALKLMLQEDIDTISARLARIEETHLLVKTRIETVGLTFTKVNRKVLTDSLEVLENGELASEMKASIKRKLKQLERIAQVAASKTESARVFNDVTYDDIITTEIHLVKGKPVEFLFRARDVIHSAFMPHFKAQMNVVPGMPTSFRMVPNITTVEAREKRGDKEFDFYLICNKVCGSGHYNMKIKVVVETEAEYQEWIKGQKPAFVKGGLDPDPVPESITADSTANTVALNIN